MTSVRQSIEHIFGLHKPAFNLFTIQNRLNLLVKGHQVYQMTLVSFFLLNCYTCFNKTSYFEVRPPTLEKYISLDEIIPEAPVIDERMFGNLYRYY